MVERVSPQQFPDADGVGDWRVLADGDTAREVGGSVVKRTDESLGKITDVIKYGLVDPTVTSR
ncbi:MAG: hypothetical protein ABIS84_11750, partial [Arachnia sp.]